MKGNGKEKLTVLLVAGVSPKNVIGLLASHNSASGEEASQVFPAKGDGSLVNVWGEPTEVEGVFNCLVAGFGSDKVVIDPASDEALRRRLL